MITFFGVVEGYPCYSHCGPGHVSVILCLLCGLEDYQTWRHFLNVSRGWYFSSIFRSRKRRADWADPTSHVAAVALIRMKSNPAYWDPKVLHPTNLFYTDWTRSKWPALFSGTGRPCDKKGRLWKQLGASWTPPLGYSATKHGLSTNEVAINVGGTLVLLLKLVAIHLFTSSICIYLHMNRYEC